MSMTRQLSRLIEEWKFRSARRRTIAALDSLPAELRRDIGWPATDFRLRMPSHTSLYRT